ncbi:signal peptidase I [Clavibacter michiganensis]|uniref:signal peptidase I n=1 Tax=Clavibacter michiganensis TaxID=28447 RepID=UPI0005B79FE3|nr:signal peptidase I [Clavibacter michiganensis]
MTDGTTPVETRSSGKHSGSTSRGWKTFLRDVLVIFVVALLVSVLIKAFLIRSFYIPSASMEDTLQIDDRIVVNQLTPRFVPLQHGDVVVFRDPGGWLLPSPEVDKPPLAAAVDWALTTVGLSAADSNDHLIKRLIGLPGDHVVCCNSLGQMSVNDVPLDEPYIKLQPGESRASQTEFDVTVPADSLWVMGDNRDNSEDSRYNVDGPTKGFVPIDNVVGRAFVITWPVDRWTFLDDFPQTFGDVPDPAPAG